MKVLFFCWQNKQKNMITFTGLYSPEIRVKFFDNIWSVFDGLFCHVAHPLPEAKLKIYMHVILSFTEWKKKKKNSGPPCSYWPPCGPPPHCRLGWSWPRASLHHHIELKGTAQTFPVLLYTSNTLGTALKRRFWCPSMLLPLQTHSLSIPS